MFTERLHQSASRPEYRSSFRICIPAVFKTPHTFADSALHQRPDRDGKFATNRTATSFGSFDIATGTGWSARVSRLRWKRRCWRSAAGRKAELLDEPIPQTDYGLNLLSGAAQFPAEPADVYVHRARFDRVLIAPHAFQQTIARQHAIPIRDQIPQ